MNRPVELPVDLGLLLRPFESLLNRNVAASTPARRLLAELAGRAFALEVAQPLSDRPLRVRLLASSTGLALSADDGPADATVAGTPFALLALLRAGSPAGRLGGAGATIRGDAEIAGAFQKLLRHARPDLEEELARVVGDAPAHQAARLARGVRDWGREARAALARNVTEWLQEEGRDLPPRAELDEFLGEVDRVRDDVDRAEARLRLLEERLRPPAD